MDIAYEALSYFNYFITFVNVLFMPYFIWILCKAKLMHKNLRYLLGATVISVCLPGIIRTLMDIIRNNLPVYLLEIACVIFNPLYSFINGTAGIGFFLIFLERFFATKRSDTYEENSTPFIAFFTIAFTCCGILFVATTLIYDKTSLEAYPINVKSCLSLERRLWAPIVGWTLYFTCVFPVIPSMHKLAQQNLRLLRSPTVNSLSSRYQHTENLKALRAIVNSFVLSNLTFGGVGLASFCFIVYLLSIQNGLDYKLMIAIKIMNLAMDLGSLFFALTLLIFHPTLIKNKRLPWSHSNKFESLKSGKIEDEGAIYFNALAKSWNK